MFAKPYKLKSNNTLKNSEKKHLAQRIHDEFPSTTEEKVKDIVSVKSSCICMKLVLHSGDMVNVYSVDGVPMVIETDERLIPTVCALWKVPDLVPVLAIHTPVLPKVQGGAPVYLPGVSIPSGGIGFPMFQRGALIGLCTQENAAVCIIGRTTMSSADMLLRAAGVCLDTIQVFGDQLCKDNKFSKIERPKLGPAVYSQGDITIDLTSHVSFILVVSAELGITAGAHRLWSHRSYKAKLPLQIILMIFNTIAFQFTATNWVRDHRLHHRYSDTDADPHNANRGFFYSHIGWLLVRKHPEVKRRGKDIDMSDIYNNPVLRFQEKYAVPLIAAMCFVLPTVIPVFFWGETWSNAWHIAMFRFVVNLNFIFLVNSAAHLWGNKPYDSKILPAQNIAVSIVAGGEGFHNYHHVFPWDYRAAELGNNYLNLTTKFIDFFAWIGWAYDLKTVSSDMIKSRAERTGDRTNLWGLEDKNALKDD